MMLRGPILLLALVAGAGAFGGLDAAGGPSRPKMPPRMTPEEFKAVVAQADSAIVEFDGLKKAAFMEDAAWIAELRDAVGGAKLKPVSSCFCLSPPDIELLAGGKPLGRVSFKHDNQLEFIARGASGDYQTDPETITRLRALIPPAEARARPQEDPRRRPAPPAKVEIQP